MELAGEERDGAPFVISDGLARLVITNLASNADDRMYVKDRESRFLFVNEAWLAAAAPGRRIEDVVGRSDADFFSAEHAAAALADERSILATGTSIEGKLERESSPDRPPAWVITTKRPLYDEGEIVGTYGITQDVSAQRRVMRRQVVLAKAGESFAGAGSTDELYEILLRSILDVLEDAEVRGAVVTLGRLSPRLAAFSNPAPDGLATLAERVRDVVGDSLCCGRRGDLAVLPVLAGGQLIAAVALERVGGLGAERLGDVTWLVETLAVILDSLVSVRRLRSLIRHASDAFAIVSPEGVIRYHAPSIERIFGFPASEAVGRSIEEFVHVEDRAAFRAALRAARADEVVSCRFRRADGAWRSTETVVANLLDDPEIGGMALAIHDVTERRALEVELRHAQKLEAIGQLAGGVAHEINTPVQFIADNLAFLEGAFTSLLDAHHALEASSGAPVVGDPEIAYLEKEIPAAIAQARDGAERVATIVRALKAFGYPDHGERRETDLNAMLANALTVARGEIKHVADVEEHYGALPPVRIVPGDLGQVLLNLIVNAAHAIAERVEASGGRGRITVATRADDDSVIVTIADDGAGIAREVAERVFEPFFTTKEVGKGTGQGLALARSVVERHGGRVSFSSTVGVGTTFVVRLPRTDREEQGVTLSEGAMSGAG